MLARELGSVHLEPDPAALTCPCPDADRAAEAVAELARSGVRIAEFTLGQPSLDEVFLALTGHPAEEQTPEQAIAIEEEQVASRCFSTETGVQAAKPPQVMHEHDPTPELPPPTRGGAVRKALSSTPAAAARERRSRPRSPSAGAGCSRSSTFPSSSST